MPAKPNSLATLGMLSDAVNDPDAKVGKDTKIKVLNALKAAKRKRNAKVRAAKLARKRNR